jgi:hypothetical protein
MDQGSIVLYFARKGLTAMAMAIPKELVATLGAEAVRYPTVTGDLREMPCKPNTMFLDLFSNYVNCERFITSGYTNRQ